MKKRNKFKNKDQFQLDFQTANGSFQKKEEELIPTAQFVGVEKAGSNEMTLSAVISSSGKGMKVQSKSLSKKSAGSKIKKLACRDKKPSGLLFDNLITVEELAVIFGLAPQTIRNWVALGKLPYVKIGKRNMFLKGSLQEWLNQKEKSQWQ